MSYEPTLVLYIFFKCATIGGCSGAPLPVRKVFDGPTALSGVYSFLTYSLKDPGIEKIIFEKSTSGNLQERCRQQDLLSEKKE